MKKKTRTIILVVCIALFFILAPYIVLYSMGYRVDFVNMKITATGGIFVKTNPQASSIIVDSKIKVKPGMFANSVFIQDLLPKEHSILIKKAGYYDYTKTLPVQENKVTKLEDILLIKQNILFDQLGNTVEYFSISPDGRNILLAGPATKSLGFEYFALSNSSQKKTFLIPIQSANILNIKWSEDSKSALIKIQKTTDAISYYIFDSTKTTQQTTALSYLDKNSQQISFNPADPAQLFYVENKILYSLKNGKPSVVLRDVVSYKIYNNSIIWTPSKGAPNKSDISGKTTVAMAKTALNPDYFKYSDYKIEIIAGKIFFIKSNSLLMYDSALDSIDELRTEIKDYQLAISPDGKNMIHYNSNEIYVYSGETKKYEKLFSGDGISDLQWLNNNYIIFELRNKIIISETDYRGDTINAVEVSHNYGMSPESKNPKIYFNTHDAKIYVLNGGTLFSSEKIIP